MVATHAAVALPDRPLLRESDALHGFSNVCRTLIVLSYLVLSVTWNSLASTRVLVKHCHFARADAIAVQSISGWGTGPAAVFPRYAC